MFSNIEILRHIKDETDFVLHHTQNKTQGEVLNDPVLCRAIVRSLEIIGEAAKKIDEEFKAEYSNIEWRKIAGTRDRLIHDYFGIDYDIVWDIIENKLPELQFAVYKILNG